MGPQADFSIFLENERKANQYSCRCLRVLAAIVACTWLMNLLGLFIVPAGIMAIACIGSMAAFLLPSFLSRAGKTEDPMGKHVIMGCCILGLTLLSAALPKHAILAWPIGIVMSCHYYSRKYTRWTMWISVICMAISLLVGIYIGEWDSNILEATQEASSVRIVTGEIVWHLILYYIIPRSMILFGITEFCVTLSDRTHALLEKQAKEEAEKHRISAELDVATKIQASMLPCIFPAFPEREEFEVFAAMNPAKEVGGDFYDFFMVDEDNLAVVVADVSGKGVPAALFMVIGKTLIKDHTVPGKDLGDVFTDVNRLLCETNSEELFITAFVGVLNLKTGQFRYVNAGHEQPFLSRAGGPFVPQKIRAAFVLAGMEDMRYKAGVFQLEPGDKIFQYTDGVTEATDSNEELFGMARLEAALAKVSSAAPREILTAVKADIDAFVGTAPQFDDITMLCLEYKKHSDNTKSLQK